MPAPLLALDDSQWRQVLRAAPVVSKVTPDATKASDTSGPVLLVPSSAWRAMELQISTLQEQQAESSRFLRCHLKMEFVRRERAAVRMQAFCRGLLARRQPIVASLRRQWHAQLHWLLLSSNRLHVSVPASVLGGNATSMNRRLLQAVARGMLVRRRVSIWFRQHKAALVLQASVRGQQTRRSTSGALERRRLLRHVQILEGKLSREATMREDLEAAMRKLWNDVYPLVAAAKTAQKAGKAQQEDRQQECSEQCNFLPSHGAHSPRVPLSPRTVTLKRDSSCPPPPPPPPHSPRISLRL